MKIFILEDDGNCSAVIDWIKSIGDEVKIARNIEDMAYYLEYEEEYKNYDKFIMDASLPEASVLHLDGTEKQYNGALNGIDYMLDNFPKLGIEMHDKKVAILTAFAGAVEEYLEGRQWNYSFKIIDKNDNQMKKQLQEFLEA